VLQLHVGFDCHIWQVSLSWRGFSVWYISHVLHFYHKFQNMELQREYLSHASLLEIVVSLCVLRNKFYECKHPAAEELQGLVQIYTKTECAKTKRLY